MRNLVSYARNHSPYLACRYRDVPTELTEVTQLPVATKAEMMSNFDQWLTDPTVNRKQVEAFIADPAHLGYDYLDRYVVCTTSGSTGTPAILLHDRAALTIYNVLGYLRSLRVVFSWREVCALLRGRGRLAAVFVTGGHFLGNTMMTRHVRAMPRRAGMQRLFSALTPLDELVTSLNDFQPVILGGYPSASRSLRKRSRTDSSASIPC